MRKLIGLLSLAAGLIGSLNAQNTVTLNKDTLLCSGKPVALLSVIEENVVAGLSSRAVYMPGGKDVLMITELKHYLTSDQKRIFYTHYEFPGIGLMCDIKHRSPNFNQFEPVCQYSLFNQYGLDTNQAFLFTTLKGTISEAELKGQKTRQDTVTMLRSIVAIRSTYAEIEYFEDNILQDGIRIGSFTVDTLQGQNGLCRYFKIFNSKDVMICTATESVLNGRDWRLLTYKDNRFHSVLSASDADLNEILKYLIQRKYI